MALPQAVANAGDSLSFGSAPLGMEVVLTTAFEPLSDATNYLGGIADVLENKSHRGPFIAHLGTLGTVALHDNDFQLRDVRCRHQTGDGDSYTVSLWQL